MEKEYSDGVASLNDIFVRRATQEDRFFARFQSLRTTSRPELKITVGSLGGSRKVVRFWSRSFTSADLALLKKNMAVDNLTWAEYFRLLKSALHSDRSIYFSFGEVSAPPQSFKSMSAQSQAQSVVEEIVETEARLKLFHSLLGRELVTTFEFTENDVDESALAVNMEYLIDQFRDFQSNKAAQPTAATGAVASPDAFRAGATTNKRMAEANRKALNFKRSGDLVNPRVNRYQPKRTRIGDGDDVSNAPQNPNRSTISGSNDD